MTIARHYMMVAKRGEGDALRAALVDLAGSVSTIEGCEGIELLRDAQQPERFFFIERWTSIEAHAIGSKQLPKGVFAPVMEALDGAPEGRWLERLSLE